MIGAYATGISSFAQGASVSTPPDLFGDCVEVCACANEGASGGQFQNCVTKDRAGVLVDLGICGNPGCINSCTGQLSSADFDGCCEVDADCDDLDECTVDNCTADGVCENLPIAGCGP